MDLLIKDAISKGCIEVVRIPRSEKLAELVRTTRAYPSGWWYWYDWGRGNRN